MPISCLKQHLHCIIMNILQLCNIKRLNITMGFCAVYCFLFFFLVSDCISLHTFLTSHYYYYIVLIFSAWSWFWLSGEHLPGPVSIYIFLIMYICVSLFGSIYTVYTVILVLGKHKVCLFLRCMKFPRNIHVFDKSVFIFEALRIISGINSCRRGILW